MIGLKVKNGNNWIDFVLDVIYPVGSLYMSINSTSPAILFGGSWAAIENRMIIGASTTYAAEATGGAATTTISSANLPTHVHSVGAHSHGLNSHTHSLSSHTHGLQSHTHTLNGHTHGAGSYSASSNGAHAHEVKSNDGKVGPFYHKDGVVQQNTTPSWARGIGIYNNNQGTDWKVIAYSAGAHTHSVTGTSGGNSGNTSGPSNNTSAGPSNDTSGQASGSTANSTAFDTGNGGFANTAMTTISPYYAAYIWRRTA